MQKPAPSYDEEKRLVALRQLGLLDTPPEERFERIINLAVLIFKVPISYISLVEADRQWFKAARGLDFRETARDISFCQYPILTLQPLVVPDALLDERFKSNPLVLNPPKVRFYAGMPIILKEGLPVATLCLMDVEPRTLSHEEMEILRELSHIVRREFELGEALTRLR
ncbi:MAG: GAF domain-containing protein [Verrucomicrobiae bacterium]|nr:GAF domain-containing protein [Verrucomicrobiae bacterium]